MIQCLFSGMLRARLSFDERDRGTLFAGGRRHFFNAAGQFVIRTARESPER